MALDFSLNTLLYCMPSKGLAKIFEKSRETRVKI
jgi:hypothetical protein